MKIRKTILSAMMLVTCCTMTAQAQDNNGEFTWTNPITNGIDAGGLRDCFVTRADGHYYLTGTSAPHWGDGYGNPGVRLYRSDDLTHWTQVGMIVKNPGTSKWYASRFWAPEIHEIDGKYYCTFNCRNERDGFNVPQSWGIAVADNIEGPYKVLDDDKPVAAGNDVTLFKDDDGQVYASWCGPTAEHTDGNVMVLAKIDLSTLTLTGQHEIFGGTQGDVATIGWDKCGVEGPCLFKRNGTYYMMYSSWQRGYEIGVAQTKDINGTWTKQANNPVFGSQSKSKWADAVETDYSDIGHNTVFTGPDGTMWLSCHGQKHNSGLPPMLYIQPMEFDADGNVKHMTPTVTKQSVIYMGTKREAEACTLEGTAKKNSDNRASGGYTVSGLGNDNWLNFTYDAPVTGNYTLSVNYVCKDETKLQAIVNGKDAGEVACEPTGLDRARGGINQVTMTIFLNSGENTIRLGNKTDAAPIIDNFILQYANAMGIKSINTSSKTDYTQQHRVYNLAGQQVEPSYKGIVISNGKKYINK